MLGGGLTLDRDKLPFSERVHRNIENGLTLLAFLLAYSFHPFFDVAYADGGLTDLFYTKSFQGSWDIMAKFSWLGYIMNFIISMFCWLGLFLVVYQRIMSILYLAGSSTWDNVYDVKEANKGSFFGVPNMAKDIFNGNRGVGVDAIMGFVYALLPNIKSYSDFNPSKPLKFNLQEGDNVATYMMKTAMPTILLIFFFTIGFSGTMVKGYGVVVDGMAAAADKAVDVSLAGYVNKVLSTGEKYTFTIGEQDSEVANFAGKVAQDIYGKVLSKMDVLDTESRMIVGKNVEDWVWDTVLGGGYQYSTLQSHLQANYSDTDSLPSVASEEDVKALKYEIIVNSNSTFNGSNRLSVPIGATFIYKNTSSSNTDNKELYLHLIITKDKVSDAAYFISPTR